MAKRVFEQNKAAGWWDNMDRDIHETLMLVVTEIAEATEGVRKDLMDDHLPHRKMEEVELADTVIRLADLAGRHGWRYVLMFPKSALNAFHIASKHPPAAAQHFHLVEMIVDLGIAIRHGDPKGSAANRAYTTALDLAILIARSRGYDLQSAIEEKLSYNRQRADHKRENRAAAGGKKF